MIRLAFVALLLLLPQPGWSGSCSGPRPQDICEVGRPGAPAAADTQPVDKPTGDAAKVTSPIRDVQRALRSMPHDAAGAAVDPASLSTRGVRVSPAGEIHVYVVLTEFRAEHVTALQAMGLRVDLTLPDHRLVQGWLAATAIDAVAALPFVKEIRPPDYPVRNGGVGQAETEGDSIVRADEARALFGVTGAGVLVGVISDGVDYLSTSVATGDLPAGVQVLFAGSGNEGTAMLEIVHDVSPGAGLAFYGPGTSAEMVAGVQALAASGARVIVDDLSFFGEPKFQDGMIAQTVRAFSSGGRIYAASAGNHTKRHYRSNYRPLTGQEFPTASYPSVHDYADEDLGNTVTIGPGCSLSVSLHWSNPVGASGDDFDLFIADSDTLEVLAQSTDPQTGTQNPSEFASWTNNTGAELAVFIGVAAFKLNTPPPTLVIDYFADRSCAEELQYVTEHESLTGNHGVEEILSTAAVGAETPDVAEDYSSRGPHTVYFPGPQIRSVPNISAPACVQTRTGQLGYFSNPFCGTSASAPHVAAVAALLLEASPGLNSTQIRNLLFGTATDLGALGFDFTYGWGRVDAVDAILVSPLPPVVQVATNAVVVHAGEVLSVAVGFFNPIGNPTLDLVMGLLLPGGHTIIPLFPGPGFGTPTSVAALSGLSPALTVPGGNGAPLGGLLQAVIPPGIPAGLYTFFAMFIRPQSLLDNAVNGGDLVAFGFRQVLLSP